MSAITTHVLDTSRGCPAQGITAVLEFKTAEGWKELARGLTNADGRILDLVPKGKKIDPGVYRLTFETKPYLEGHQIAGFYPYVPIVFEVRDSEQHYHVPLLLSPFGYSTYRGS